MSDNFTEKLLNRGHSPNEPADSSPLLAKIYRGSGWVSALGFVVCIGFALTSEGVSQMMAGFYAVLCIVWALFGFGMAEMVDCVSEIEANTRRERNDEIVGVLRRIEALLAVKDENATPEKSGGSKITWVPKP